jgi:hypothetical protein
VHPKLVWSQELGNSIAGAIGGLVSVTMVDHVDPLKKLIVLDLGEELGKGDYQPIQKMAHAFAKANNCALERIRRQPRKLILEVLIKTRLGPVEDKNPLK